MINEIKICESKLSQAIKKNDLAELDDLLHEDLLFVNPLGKVITKALDLENYASGQISITSLEFYEQTINIIDNTAVVTVIVKMIGKYLEHPLNESFRFLRIWKREELKWRVIGGSSIKI